MSATFVRARKKILDADIDFLVDTLKFFLIDLNDLTQLKAITNATNATPIVVTSTAHGLTTGDYVNITGVGGNTNANGHRQVTVVDANTYSLQDPNTGANIAGSGAYTSGGFGLSLEVIEFVSDIAGAAIASRGPALGTKTTTRGNFDAADFSFSAVPLNDPCEALLLVKDTGADGTSPVIAIIDSGTGFPITPNGGNIDVTINASGILQLI